jgi:hypothetical protein
MHDEPEGNERITATNGFVLFILLIVEGVTLLSLSSLLSVHVFLGLLLIPPVALKLASTGWRFMRYYTGSAPYRLKGPPHIALRLLAPLLVLSTVALFGTGVALVVRGSRGGTLSTLHTMSFLAWVGLIAIHALAHLERMLRSGSADWRRRRTRLQGVALRRAAVVGALALGIVVALVTLPAQDDLLRARNEPHGQHDR